MDTVHCCMSYAMVNWLKLSLFDYPAPGVAGLLRLTVPSVDVLRYLEMPFLVALSVAHDVEGVAPAVPKRLSSSSYLCRGRCSS